MRGGRIVVVMMFVLVMATVSSMNTKDANVIKPIINDKGSYDLLAEAKGEIPIIKIKTLTDIPIAVTPYDEIHPNIVDNAPFYLLSYSYVASEEDKEIWLISSRDNGTTFEDVFVIYLDGIQDYPSFDYWGGNTFYGTFEPGEEAYTYLTTVSDISTSVEGITTFWDWSPFGWYDFKMPDIACHNSQNPWEFGVIAFVASTTYPGYECENAPNMVFADPERENYAYISWWPYYEGVLHASASIDKKTNIIYCAYDWYNPETQKYNIIVWKRSFANPFAYSYMIEIPSYYNAICPSIVAEGNKIAIVCQSDENGNQDIICFYSTNAGATWYKSFVAYNQENEMYPDIAIQGEKLACTFIKDGNLYCTYSNDWGTTWDDKPLIVNDVPGNVVMEYRSASISKYGIVWTDLRNGNKDIYFDVHPEISFNISAEGGFGLTITITNSGTTTAENQQWNISLSGLVFFNKESGGVIDELKPGESTTIKIIPFGIGSFEAKIKIYKTEATINGFLIGPIVLL